MNVYKDADEAFLIIIIHLPNTSKPKFEIKSISNLYSIFLISNSNKYWIYFGGKGN